MAGAVSADARGTIAELLLREREAQTRFLAELVSFPSENPPGDCRPHAEKAAGLLEALGFTVERHPVPEELVKASGMLSCTNLVVRERFASGGPTVALNAHGDVVPPCGGWSCDPYGAQIRAGRMFGRGVAVSKSDIATYAWALLALRRSGARLRGAVELHFTYDEEAGGMLGPKLLLAKGLSTADYAICAGFSYCVTTAHNGCLHLEVEVLGKSGHAAEPKLGVDALEAATTVLSDLYAYRNALAAQRSAIPGIGHPSLVVGLISGGVNTNVVPDRVVFRLDRRITPDENPEDALSELTELIRQSAHKLPGIRVEVRKILLANPLLPGAGQARLVQALQARARQVFGVEIEPCGVPLYTDARHYAEAGIPTVLYGAGPRTLAEANGHCADENLRLEDLYKATEVIALSLLDLLGTGD